MLISLGDVAYSVLIVSMVLISRMIDVKLGVLYCFLANLWVVCGFFDLVGFGRRRKSVLCIPKTASSSSWLQGVGVCVTGVCIIEGLDPSLGVEVLCDG